MTLSSDNIVIILWYVDASYESHDDSTRNTSSMLTVGSGVITFLRKQKINVKSLVEVELIEMDDTIHQTLETRCQLQNGREHSYSE